MRKTTKMTVAAAIAVVLSGGVAAAATGNLPTQADDGVSTANDHSAVEVPATHEQSTTSDDSDESVQSSEDTASSDTGTHPDNHGAAVSAVAQSTDTTGADHGAAVSAVARDNTGQNDHAADDANAGASNADESHP